MIDFGVFPILADAGVFKYFMDSNLAGKVFIFILAMMNCYAVSVMWYKMKQIRQMTQIIKRRYMVQIVRERQMRQIENRRELMDGWMYLPLFNC